MYHLSPDVVAIIPPHVHYASRAEETFDQLYLHFYWDVEGGNEILLCPAASGDKWLASVDTWFENPRFCGVFLYSLLLNYLSEVAGRVTVSGEMDPRIRQAVEHMGSCGGCTVNDVAQKLFMSRDHFQRKFREDTGISPKRYWMARRMEKAQQLLLSADIGIDEIAVTTGFCDRYQFSKAFKKFFGTSPAAYRKQTL